MNNTPTPYTAAPDFEVVLVTPEFAEAQLGKMYKKQRPMTKANERLLAASVRNGTFNGFNGETVIKHSSDVWLDCQHRFQAVVDSGRSTYMVVATVYGDIDAIYRTIDSGRSRSMAESLGLTSREAAAAKLIYALSDSAPLKSALQKKLECGRGPTNDEIYDFTNILGKELETVCGYGEQANKAKLGSGAVHSAFYYIARTLDGNFCEEFFNGFTSNSPVEASVATERVIHNTKGKGRLSNSDLFGYLAQGYAAYRSGSTPPKCFNKGLSHAEALLAEFRNKLDGGDQ